MFFCVVLFLVRGEEEGRAGKGREGGKKGESRIQNQRRRGTEEGQAEEEEVLGETKERRTCVFKSGINGRASV